MRRLKELGKIKFGKRYTIYSIKDGKKSPSSTN